jgi:hypothetical protein
MSKDKKQVGVMITLHDLTGVLQPCPAWKSHLKLSYSSRGVAHHDQYSWSTRGAWYSYLEKLENISLTPFSVPFGM